MFRDIFQNKGHVFSRVQIVNCDRAIAPHPGMTRGELLPLGSVRIYSEQGDCSSEASHSLCDSSECNSVVPNSNTAET